MNGFFRVDRYAFAGNLRLKSLIGDLFRTHDVERVDNRRVLKRFIQLGPLGRRGLRAENRQVEVSGAAGDPAGARPEHTHLPNKRKMAKRVAKRINIFVTESR